ncbi:Endonuclease/Exonuclease/phosphatase family protein [Novipirellula aureliae]|uniref:Endonuclease/Exonuclease/phosphatase family protein n=1 Tax=Novipirellula aureliae TaxID=2527966 RepID=A0A5C6DL23_9BACT|nr:endonuclease/exonuclease/phosphatase family protein [Novipirellula aureliae]TWU36517.1 Endonuclease/Exonuclease/phosphatase family protein [Novipirellula aureliae]
MFCTLYSSLLAGIVSLGLAIFWATPILSGEGEPLRVMSFNIRYGSAKDGDNHWDKRKHLVAKSIEEFAPDLLGTQETLAFQKTYLQQQIPRYTSIGVGRDTGGDEGEMTAIFYRTDRFEEVDMGHFWLSETPAIPGSMSWDTSLTRMCSWVKLRDRLQPSLRPVLFMNTHFDHRGPRARVESAKLVRQQAFQIGEGCDIVITGDFNSGVGSEPYRAMFEAESPATTPTDTFAVAGDSSAGEATFSGFRAGVTDGGRIDWIAVAGQWTIRSAGIDRTDYQGRTPSDHYPVTATIVRSGVPK